MDAFLNSSIQKNHDVDINSRQGIVVVLPEGQLAVKVGRAAVLIEGEAKPISFKLMNLRIEN